MRAIGEVLAQAERCVNGGLVPTHCWLPRPLWDELVLERLELAGRSAAMLEALEQPKELVLQVLSGPILLAPHEAKVIAWGFGEPWPTMTIGGDRG